MPTKFKIDPHNRLTAGVSKFRHIIEGRFNIGSGNTLIYHIKTPSEGVVKELGLPHQLKFKGRWSLTDENDLRLTLNKWRRQTFGDELTLKGEIIKVDAGSLLFALTQRTKENIASTYILKLEGSWQADKDNRLTFRIRKEKGRSDKLVFDGVWKAGSGHSIKYTYESRIGKRKRRVKKRTLFFNGSWNITERGALGYRLSVAGRPTIALYGKWKIKKGAGLTFELAYGRGRSSAIKFSAEAKLAGNNRIRFTLRSGAGKDLKLVFTLAKSMLKGQGESFIRFLRSNKEKAVYIGAGFMW